MRETRLVFEKQFAMHRAQAIEAAKLNKYYEFIEMQHYIPKFELHLEQLARYFIKKEDHKDSDLDFLLTPLDDKGPFYYITKVSERLASLHFEHKQPAVAAERRVVLEDKNFQRLREEFYSFLDRIGNYDWLLSPHVTALRLHMKVFFGDSNTRQRQVKKTDGT